MRHSPHAKHAGFSFSPRHGTVRAVANTQTDSGNSSSTAEEKTNVDFAEFRRTTFQYWEKRRLWYNFFLLFPAFLGYFPAIVSGAVGDPNFLGTAGILGLWLLCFIGANICFTFIYALEFMFAAQKPSGAWFTGGRALCFVLGTLFAMVLAFISARNIALWENYGPPVFTSPHLQGDASPVE
jgi:hypothetical protein